MQSKACLAVPHTKSGFLPPSSSTGSNDSEVVWGDGDLDDSEAIPEEEDAPDIDEALEDEPSLASPTKLDREEASEIAPDEEEEGEGAEELEAGTSTSTGRTTSGGIGWATSVILIK